MKITGKRNGPSTVFKGDGHRRSNDGNRRKSDAAPREQRFTSSSSANSISAEQIKVGVVFLGRRRPGFDMAWGGKMEERVRTWLRESDFSVVEPTEKAIDDWSLRKAMAACESEKVDALVVLQTTMGDARLASTLAQLWPDLLILWATPENQTGEMISSCSLVGAHCWASV